MTHLLNEQECGITFGTEVQLIRPKIITKNSEICFSISGNECAEIKLKFNRAGYNHYDEVYSYCFKLPSDEELWIHMPDRLSAEQRIDCLRELMDW